MMPHPAAHKRPDLLGGAPTRPDLLGAAQKRLTFLERLHLRIIRASFEPGLLDRLLRWCQRTVGQSWIHHCTKNLRHVVGLSDLDDWDAPGSVLIVANHRTFFDLYVITAELVRRGMKKRILFPVRSKFFYDSPFGFIVNLGMSFLAMYPPIFRERKKLAMNLLALDELSYLLHRGGTFVGLHPEGTRKLDDDPYTFLPAQPGVGRVIQSARVPVIPVFVNGLRNGMWEQVRTNFDGTGQPIYLVFGRPISFGDLLDQPFHAKTHRKIAERCMEAISALSQQEKALREASAIPKDRW